MLLPRVRRAGAEHDLAPTRAVDLHPWVAAPGRHRGGVAVEQGASAALQQLSGAGVVAGVEAEGLARTAGSDEGLGDAIRRPWFLAAGPQGKGHLERDGRQPEGMNSR